MKHKALAVRSMLGWLLLAACVVLAVWSVLKGCTPVQQTSFAAGMHKGNVQPIPVQTGAVPVNHADAALLDQLPGVGESTALAILEERKNNGPFFYPEDLMHVRGIGEKKLGNMRDLLDLTEE